MSDATEARAIKLDVKGVVRTEMNATYLTTTYQTGNKHQHVTKYTNLPVLHFSLHLCAKPQFRH